MCMLCSLSSSDNPMHPPFLKSELFLWGHSKMHEKNNLKCHMWSDFPNLVALSLELKKADISKAMWKVKEKHQSKTYKMNIAQNENNVKEQENKRRCRKMEVM